MKKKTIKKTKNKNQIIRVGTTQKTKSKANLPAKAKNTNTLTATKQQELKKLITAYQQVGISLTKLLKN
jgi:hypothetical protein